MLTVEKDSKIFREVRKMKIKLKKVDKRADGKFY